MSLTQHHDRLPDPKIDDVRGEPVPPIVDRGSALNRLPRLPFELFLALLIGFVLLGAVLILSRISLGEAERERNAAVQAQQVAADDASAAAADVSELAAASVELQQQVDQLTVDLEAARADATIDVPAVEPSPDADPTVDEIAALEERIEALSASNTDLETQLAEALAASPEAIEPAPSPSFAQYVGEVLASADGVRISRDDAMCLGQTVIDTVGLEAIGAGLNRDKTSASNTVISRSVTDAASACGIDPSRVFGQ